MTKIFEELQPEDSLRRRVVWLIQLRWFAAAGVLMTVLLLPRLTDLSLMSLPLCGVAGLLMAENLVSVVLVSRIRKQSAAAAVKLNLLANLQISLDLLCLALLIHFSGGFENPFAFYFIFHMIIASILLTRRAAFLQATYASALFLLIVIGEHEALIAHYCLWGATAHPLYDRVAYVGGLCFVFISTLYISVYLATSIANELRERDRSLTLANELLKEKDRIKSEYVLRVTHDIKDDLSAVDICIAPVIMEITGTLNEAQKGLLHRSKERIKKLIVYINALLQITRIKLTKKLEPEIFPFQELVEDVAETIRLRAQNSRIHFEVKVPGDITTIRGVRVYVQEALLNLLTNAMKYTPAGGKVLLEAARDAQTLRIKVKDTGIGIPPEGLTKIFDEFYRAGNAREQEKTGRGLGLSIVKEIVDLHGGTIRVESQLGAGTAFYLEFPHAL